MINDWIHLYFAMNINKIIDQTDSLLVCIRKLFGAPPAWMFGWPVTN